MLNDTIYTRRSCRSYDKTQLDDECLSDIRKFIESAGRLHPDIEFSYDILESSNVRTLMPWTAPYYIAIYSKPLDDYYENIGFIFQQVDLYLQSIELGSCWVGMGKPKKDKLEEHPDEDFIILLAFGKTSHSKRSSKDDFNRLNLNDISDQEDEGLLPVLYAPSAMNSQPWYFTHNSDGSYNVYRRNLNILKRKVIGYMNKIDIGIALAHVYVANATSFDYYYDAKSHELYGYTYVGSFRI